MTTYTLFELNEYIRRVIALNFTESIWVSCELSQVKEARGQVYLDLIQHDEVKQEVLAQSGAVIMYKSMLFLQKKLGNLLPAILNPGTKVMLKVLVQYNERYGMKLIIEDIEPSYTIGQMEMARQKIIEQLKQSGVMDVNRLLPIPLVIQRVAVISSPTAAGYQDFYHQIQSNEYGYAITIDLYESAMQGSNTEREVTASIEAINAAKEKYDVIVIIRGGGSKLDLASFDNYNIGHAVATSKYPVFTGIGHEIDNTVPDLVSAKSFKTPTAVASFIIDHNAYFESKIIQTGVDIYRIARQSIEYHKLQLSQQNQLLALRPKEILRNAYTTLLQTKSLLRQAARYSLKEWVENIEYSQKLVSLADPKNILKRGFTIIKKKGKLVSSISEVTIGDAVSIEYYDGEAKASITEINQKK